MEDVSSIHEFDVGVTLGTGSFGRVRFATHRRNRKHYAVKVLKKSEIIRFQQLEHLKSETSILQLLSQDPHPFMVNLATTFQDDRYLYMVLEYVNGGEFFTYLRNVGQFECDAAQFYAAHVVLMFESLHSRDIIYRDLKPENLLLDRDGYLKVTDFGFAKRVKFKTYTLCGTPEYIAPEVLLNKGHGKGVDWWTLGILIYEMLAGEPPFVDEDPMCIYQQVLSSKVCFPRGFDKSAKSLVKKLLISDLTKRYGCLKAGVHDIKKSKLFISMDFQKLLNKGIDAPIIPHLNGDDDTSNFENYEESDDEAIIPNFNDGEDPFVDFSNNY